MRALTNMEVQQVSGGDDDSSGWADFWNSVENFLSNLFGGSSSGGSGLSAAVTLCSTNNGTGNFTVNGTETTVTYQGTATAPVDGMQIPISVQVGMNSVAEHYTVTCQGTHSGPVTTMPKAQ